jgi:hypothetical protein
VGNELDPKKIAGEIAFVGATPTAPLPEVAITPLAPATSTSRSPVSVTSNTIEITRSPQPIVNQSIINQPIINQPIPSPTASTPSSIFIEPLPDVPQPVTTIPSATPTPQTTTSVPTSNAATPINFSESPNEVLIDRDPIPVVPPQSVSPPKSQFIPSNSSSQNIPNPSVQTPPTATTSAAPKPIPYNSKIAALVPPPARDTTPYLVIIPSSDSEVLNRVRSAVPSAKVIPSRFGNIIMVQGYPDRDRAEVLKVIMRSAIGLDARVIHQNSL